MKLCAYAVKTIKGPRRFLPHRRSRNIEAHSEGASFVSLNTPMFPYAPMCLCGETLRGLHHPTKHSPMFPYVPMHLCGEKLPGMFNPFTTKPLFFKQIYDL